MSNKKNKKEKNNEKKNSKFNWNKFMESAMIGLCLMLIFISGMSFGNGNWTNGLCNLLWAFVMFNSIKVYRRYNNAVDEYIDAMKHGAILFLKAKTTDMKLKYFEDRFGSFEDLIKKEEKDPNPPSHEETHEEQAGPTSSAASNEENEMGHIAEGVGSHD